MTSIITFLLIISFLIFIHELGHLLAAKWANVKVEAFSIGFGPKVFSFYYGETEYSLSLLPLGGYVKMQGENELSDESDKNRNLDIQEERSYKNTPNYKKQIILFAGPLMNLIVPFLFFPIIYMIGIEVPKFLDEVPVVGYYKNEANEAFFKKGDVVLRINNSELESWRSISEERTKFLGKRQEVEVLRNNKIHVIDFKNTGKEKRYILDEVFPEQPPIIDQVIPQTKADEIGLQRFDTIKEINGIKIFSWYQISEVLNDKGTLFKIKIERKGGILHREISFSEDKSKKLLGITPFVQLRGQELTLLESLHKGYVDSIRSIKLIFNGIMHLLSNLFASESSLEEIKSSLAGPIAIAKYSGVAAERGINSILQFMIVISINLGIINLLPIPLLDGGHIFFNSIEIITRRKINPKFLNVANRIGFAALITLMLFAIYNDIVNF